MNAKARHRRRRRAEAAAQTKAHLRARDIVDTHVDSACRVERAWVKGKAHWTLARGELHILFTAVKRGSLEAVVANGMVRV